MKQLVKLRKKLSRDGRSFTYYMDYIDENGQRRKLSLGHANLRKANRQVAQKERELRMGVIVPDSMRLSAFTRDSLKRTGSQIRESTQYEYRSAMKAFIRVVGNIDYQQITLDHAERFRQACLDKGDAAATVSKKLRGLKRLFQLAVNRRQLDENPLLNVDKPKSSKKKPRVYTPAERQRILRAAADLANSRNPEYNLRWHLLILTALVTGMRKSELLNCTWSDIDFEFKQITVTAKDDTDLTWRWLIKDSEEREVPLTDELLQALADHQAAQPAGQPYVFVPPGRYRNIQRLRDMGKWTLSDARLKVTSNFYPQFHRILKAAAIRKGKFHDFRRTAITNWFEEGLREFDVMKLAGHSSFETTHQFYLAIRGDLVDRARAASEKVAGRNLSLTCPSPPKKATRQEIDTNVSDSREMLYGNGQGRI